MEGKEQKLESKSGFQKFQENVKVYVVHVEREFTRKTIKKHKGSSMHLVILTSYFHSSAKMLKNLCKRTDTLKDYNDNLSKDFSICFSH